MPRTCTIVRSIVQVFRLFKCWNIIGCMTGDIIYLVNITYAISINSYQINGGLLPPILGRSSTFPQNLWSMDLAMNSLNPHFCIIFELSTSFRKMRSWTIASVPVNVIYFSLIDRKCLYYIPCQSKMILLFWVLSMNLTWKVASMWMGLHVWLSQLSHFHMLF